MTGSKMIAELASEYPTALRNVELGIDCGAGWFELCLELIKLCDKRGVEVVQIKQKFGELRFYVGEAPNEVHEAIRLAMDRSHTICEECGKPGKRGGRNWIATLCDEHRGSGL